jgi:hypothetical protein
MSKQTIREFSIFTCPLTDFCPRREDRCRNTWKGKSFELTYNCIRPKGHEGYCHDHDNANLMCYVVWNEARGEPIYKNRIQKLRKEMEKMQ